MFARQLFNFGAFFGIFIVVATAGLAAAFALWHLTGFEWALGGALLLMFSAMGLVGLYSSGGDRPPMFSGFWDTYAEMMGRQAAGGSMRDMLRPPSFWGSAPILVNAGLLFAAGVLILLVPVLA
jgi:hypothetical protein